MGTDSSFTEWRRGMLGSILDVVEYWRQRSLILRQPELILSDPEQKLSIQPFAFGVRSLLLFSAISPIIQRLVVTFVDLPPAPFDVLIDMVPDEIAAEIENAKKVSALSATLQPMVVSTALLITANLFQRLLGRPAKAASHGSEASRVYLYYVTAMLFLPNLALAVSVHSIDVAERFVHQSVFYFDPQPLLGLKFGVALICGVWGLVCLQRASPPTARLLGLTDLYGEGRAMRFTANRLALAAIVTNIALLVALNVLLRLYGWYLAL